MNNLYAVQRALDKLHEGITQPDAIIVSSNLGPVALRRGLKPLLLDFDGKPVGEVEEPSTSELISHLILRQ